jgi:hypothetical protein
MGSALSIGATYDAGMQLDRSRTALRQATQAVEELRAAKDDPELFRDRFVSTMGMVERVGSIIAEETKGHRTAEFGIWWKETQSEPLFVFMRDVRNAEYKQGERRQVSVQFGSSTMTQEMTIRGTPQVLDKDGRVVDDSEPPPPSEPPSPTPQDTSADPPPQWEFVGEGKFKGGEFDGHEVFALLDRYLAWLHEKVLPTAERLTT